MADIISALGVLIAAVTFWAGVSAWKREFVGKRRIELAETVLALFYEAEDAIREIRNPFSYVGEGSTRKRSDGEREEESKLLDQAFVVFERYQRHEKLFSQLKSMRYQCMAAFGAKASKPFDEVSDVVRRIFASARSLGTHYWPRQGRVQMTEEEFEKHLNAMHKHEAVFWFVGNEEDEISPRVKEAVESMEAITQEAVSAKIGFLKSALEWAKKRVRFS